MASTDTAVGDLDALRQDLAALGAVVVAFSGGADSALLAHVAHEVLGERAVAVTAISPSLAADEREACRALTETWGMRWVPVATDELERAAYVRNDGDRCFWCKDALMDAVAPVAEELGATVVLGVNVDDLGDHRPGQRAAAARGARFPLVDAGFTKDAVRATSRGRGLPTWDKPAAACLASRVPYGTEVTIGVLGQVERAEAGLRRLGHRALRVRHHGEMARIEVPLDELDRVLARREEVVAAVRGAGYAYAVLDLEGLRSGNLNAALGLPGTGA